MKESSVLFITRKWAPATGGMETYSLRLTEALAETGRVDVLALAGRDNGMPPNVLALLGFPFTVLAKYLTLFFSGDRPNVVHLGDMAIWPLGLPALFWRSSQIAISAHGTDVAYHRRGGLKGALYGIYMKAGSRLLSKARVIANSASTARISRETGWTNMSIVPLASDFPAAAKTAGGHRSILFAGRLIKHKGCAWFIREVLPQLPADITLQVAGTPWDKSELEALDNSRVEFLGRLDQDTLARAYTNALCVIMPNVEVASKECEGFGLVAPEAAAAGGVVLAANHGGLTDAVIDGVTGILIETGSAEHWVQAVIDIAGWDAQKRHDFTHNAQSAARAHYCWARVARDTRNAYRERPA